MYAAASVPFYSIVNLVDRQVEVYSDPSADGYQTPRDFGPDDHVPLVIDGVEVGRTAVAGLLP